MAGIIWLGGAASAGVLCGCTTAYDTNRVQLRVEHESGNYAGAAGFLDAPATQEMYGERNRLLWLLERGAVASALNDSGKSLSTLEDAEKTIDAQRELKPDEKISRWVLNDTVAPYIAPAYEDMYVNVFKILARLERGELDGGATVEARRLANKSNLLRDQYLHEVDALKQRAGASYGAAEKSGATRQFATPTGGEFIESPLGTYLTAITFMKTRDREFQRVAGKRLIEAMEAQPKLFPGVNKAAFSNLSDLNPGAGNVLVVAMSGCGPYLEAQRVGPIAILSLPVYFELPRLRLRGSQAAAASLEVQDASGAAREAARLELVEDLSAVTQENFARELPLIYQRTLVRYLVKAAVTVGASEAVAQTQHRGDTQMLIRAVGGLVGLGVLGATEKADLRYWECLPAKAFVGLASLAPGTYRYRVNYLGVSGGVVYSSAWRDLVIPAGNPADQLATVVDTIAK